MILFWWVIYRSSYHNSEVITAFRDVDVEGRVTSLGGFIDSEDSFRVSEDILGSDESVHSALNAHEGGFSRDSSWSSLGVRKLFTGTDSTEGDVMSTEHADRVFHLDGGSAHKCTIRADRRNSAVNYVIDLVGLERKGLAKTSSDFVLQNHTLKHHVAVDRWILMGSSKHSRVEVVVAKLTSTVGLRRRRSRVRNC